MPYDREARNRRMQTPVPAPQHAPAQAGPAGTPPGPAPRRHRRRHLTRAGRIFFGVLGALAAGLFAALVVTGGGKGAAYRAVIGDYRVLSPSLIDVTVHVTNSGSSAGTPTCTIRARDASGTYAGTSTGTLTSSIPAGQRDTYVDQVTISNAGASRVTKVTVSC